MEYVRDELIFGNMKQTNLVLSRIIVTIDKSAYRAYTFNEKSKLPKKISALTLTITDNR